MSYSKSMHSCTSKLKHFAQGWVNIYVLSFYSLELWENDMKHENEQSIIQSLQANGLKSRTPRILTHLPLVMHICESESGQHWFRLWLVAYLVPSHYLNQCWVIVNWTLRNKLQWNFNRNSYIFLQENAFESVICKMVVMLSQPQCVKRKPTFIREMELVSLSCNHILISVECVGRGWC